MNILELPIIFCRNYKEIELAKEQNLGIEPERDEYTVNITFYLPKNTYVRITELNREGKCAILIGDYVDEVFTVDGDYQTIVSRVNDIMKGEK